MSRGIEQIIQQHLQPSIGTIPQKAFTTVDPKHVWTKVYSQVPTNKTSEIGERRSHSDFKASLYFLKGYLSAWSQEIYIVTNVVIGAPVVYKIRDLGGEILEDTFYEKELQKVEMVPEAQ